MSDRVSDDPVPVCGFCIVLSQTMVQLTKKAVNTFVCLYLEAARRTERECTSDKLSSNA